MPNIFEYKCPVCDQPLVLRSGPYACKNNHSYDLSREGYVNLLLSHHKRSRNPGDSPEMIQSRQRFLGKGYYQVLYQAIIDCVGSLPKGFDQGLLDIGCGEGYYLDQLHKASATLRLAGIDISKPAVRLAAKRKTSAQLAVISAYALPFFDKTFDTALSVFSPISTSETARILASNGRAIMVGPGEEHLPGLKSQIYDKTILREGNYQVFDNSPEFQLQDQREIKQTISVEGEDLLDLLTMTPYYWSTTPEQKEKLANLVQLETPVHFFIKIYAKK